MSYTNKQELTAKYLYNMLTLKKSGSDIERLGNTLFNSKIKLTPHQIQAALFAFKSPIDKGVILADEVGLGKTIEAGIVILQTWFEKHKQILVVAPASLIKQWQVEMTDKFGLESEVLDRKFYNEKIKNGYSNPLSATHKPIILCSYQMCSTFKEEIKSHDFSLAVVDEAHKLRNIHNNKGATSNNVKYAIENFKKVLLTATPIQNNLLDLYGISSVIDDEIFGDKTIFRENYIKNFYENKTELEERLKPVLHRTLRTQVQPYIQFTKRIPKTFFFNLTNEEQMVYDMIQHLINHSDEETYLLPSKQKHLLLLILCKLMGSSMSSITYTLEQMLHRLYKLLDTGIEDDVDLSDLEIDEEYDDSLQEDISAKNKIDVNKLKAEICNLEKIIATARIVNNESKYTALKSALQFSFEHLSQMGAEEKVIIFTESKRTQDFLYQQLSKDGYSDILLFNGNNNNSLTTKVYEKWKENPKNKHKISPNKALNIRTAILDEFKDNGKILITTEAGAEGLNMQFCSLVINYDLPWNPQRVEQRIGRCHRFGQKHDVVVINFISETNIIEKRVYDLLNNKFKLFNEILGSSDAILGTIDDGRDIEKSIIEIYKTCRTTDEIEDAFNKLQEKYKSDIEISMTAAKEDLLKNFEEDVQSYFEDVLLTSESCISEVEKQLFRILKCMWIDKVKFIDEISFLFEDARYCFVSKNLENEYCDFGLNTELGKLLLKECSEINTSTAFIEFDISNYKFKLSRIESLKGKKGYITLQKVYIESFDQEEYLIFNGILEDGTRLSDEMCHTIFRLDTKEHFMMLDKNPLLDVLLQDVDVSINAKINDVTMKNNKYLSDEILKVNAFIDDKIQSIQLNVEKMRNQRKELQRESDSCTNLKDKEAIEHQISDLSKKIKQSWLQLAMVEEELEDKRRQMIENIKKQNMKTVKTENIFTIAFEVI